MCAARTYLRSDSLKTYFTRALVCDWVVFPSDNMRSQTLKDLVSAAVPSLSGGHLLHLYGTESLVHEAEGKTAEGPALPLCTSGQLHRDGRVCAGVRMPDPRNRCDTWHFWSTCSCARHWPRVSKCLGAILLNISDNSCHFIDEDTEVQASAGTCQRCTRTEPGVN